MAVLARLPDRVGCAGGPRRPALLPLTTFEFVMPGAATRFERAKARWKWFVGVVVVALVGALVAKLIN
jgi:hypothetical protein